jgi:2-aminobenzoylacetyl-CoA thioesterase
LRSRKPGRITDNLWYLGREETGIYFLQGSDSAIIINGGISYILSDVLAQMHDFGLNPKKINKFLILHSHFDHVGVAPYFKRICPEIELVASEAAWRIFAKPKAIEVINSFNQLSARQVNASESVQAQDVDWYEGITGTSVTTGDRIDLGGVALSIVETPGHSNCSISAYEPNERLLFASDAVGIPYKDTIFPSMNTNISQFLDSLERLKPLHVSYLCADHYGYVTGEEAGTFIDMSVEAAVKWKSILEDFYRDCSGDLDAASKAITAFFYREKPDYFIAPDILEGVFKQMLKYIAKSFQQTE